MKKALRIIGIGIIHVLLYIVFAFLLLVLATLTGTKDVNGVTHISGIVLLGVFVIPAFLIWVFIRIKKARDKSKTALENHTIEEQLPVTHEEKLPVNDNVAPMESVDKMDGHQFEYFCADLLRKNGFTDVEVTKGSGDQGVDVLAEKDGIRFAIQCKCYSSDLGNRPIQEAFAGKSIYNCQIAAVLTNRFFTQGGIEAARATGVLLWDRKKLQSFIDNAEQ